MSQSQMRERYNLLGKDGQSFKDYCEQEIADCSEQLRKAVAEAATDRDGKPVFYTILRHVSRSGMRRTISVHYVNAGTGEIYQLNYVASVLLDRALDKSRDGVVCHGCGMDMGFDLVYTLAHAATGDGYAIRQRWL